MKKKIFLFALALLFSASSVAFAGESRDISPYNIVGLDDRYKVDSTTAPYLSICKLLITYDTGETEGGTGFLISPTRVATAAHCLDYQSKPDKDGKIEADRKAESIEVLFGVTGTSNYSHKQVCRVTVDCTAKNTIVSPDWNRNNANYDYGLIILPEEVDTGFYFDLHNCSPDTDGVSASIVGYEHNGLINSKFYNYQLIQGDGNVYEQDDWRFKTHIGALPGESGAPVLDSENRVIGIFTYDAGDYFMDVSETKWNKATRMTEDVIKFYQKKY